MLELEKFIRDVPDFPKKGIVFKDITPLLADPAALQCAIEQLAKPYLNSGIKTVVGIESRGFIFGAAVARALNAGFVPLRKAGKLPWKTVRKSYALEYGTDSIEIHADAVGAGDKVLMIDDLLATGGTMKAACELVSQLGGKIVGVAFLVELDFLAGRKKLNGYDILTIVHVK